MIRATAIVVLCILGGSKLSAQGNQPCSDPAAREFDFWIGEWELTWPGGQMGVPEGQTGHATNTISKILGGCTVFEQFNWASGGFEGKSFSVYNPNRELWQQTWVDNQGGYLVFTGNMKDGTMELRTPKVVRNGKTFISRMVFTNITKNELDWYWQRSSDEGKTWTDLWTIHYRRKSTE